MAAQTGRAVAQSRKTSVSRCFRCCPGTCDAGSYGGRPEYSQITLRCREIVEADLEGIIDLLTFGFSAERDKAFWQLALGRLARHATPPGYPRFGYLLDNAGEVVGVVLQIFSQAGPVAPVRCNMSSWWVMPAFRVYGPMLVARALRHDATFTDITPAPHTWKILEAQGYVRYCNGWVVALPWLSHDAETARVAIFRADTVPDEFLTGRDIDLLRDHAAYGCICLLCEADGRRYPFVFAPRWRYGVIGIAQPVYCSEDADFRRFAGALGRYLARRGFVFMFIDADGPLPGIFGIHNPRRPKFYKGPDRPRLGDYAYTERAMFGS